MVAGFERFESLQQATEIVASFKQPGWWMIAEDQDEYIIAEEDLGPGSLKIFKKHDTIRVKKKESLEVTSELQENINGKQ